jgi:hypothetical protein
VGKDSEPVLEAVFQTKTEITPPIFKLTTMAKPLHGKYPTEISVVTDNKHSYKWMKRVELKVETEALIPAAQEHALNTHLQNVLGIKRDGKSD